MNEHATEILLQIHRTMRAMQRRNRTVSGTYGSEIALVDSAVIQELLSDSALEAKRLAHRLRISKVQISRIVTRLTRLGYIEKHLDQKDRRINRLLVSSRGKQIFATLSKRAHAAFSSAYARLNADEKKRFADYLLRMLNDYGAPVASSLPYDPPLMIEIRRLTRMFGFYTNSVFGIRGLTLLTWHLISRIAESSSPSTLTELSTELAISPTTASTAIHRLRREGLVKTSTSPRDHRRVSLVASTKGLKMHRRIEHSALRQMKRACRQFSEKELEDFAVLWLRYSGGEHFRDHIIINSESGFRLLRSENERSVARKFLFEERVRQGLLNDLPALTVGEHSFTYALMTKDQIRGCVEFIKTEHGWSVLHFLVREDLDRVALFASLLFDQFFATSSALKLTLAKSALSVSVARLFPALTTRSKVEISRTRLRRELSAQLT